jgi:hypothetical protein
MVAAMQTKAARRGITDVECVQAGYLTYHTLERLLTSSENVPLVVDFRDGGPG